MSSEPTTASRESGDPYVPPRVDTHVEPGDDPSTVGQGVLAGVVILVACFGLVFFDPLMAVGLFGGVVQWLIVAPLVVGWRRGGRHAAVRGLLIVAGIGFLINATCTGFFLYSLRDGMH